MNVKELKILLLGFTLEILMQSICFVFSCYLLHDGVQFCRGQFAAKFPHLFLCDVSAVVFVQCLESQLGPSGHLSLKEKNIIILYKF